MFKDEIVVDWGGLLRRWGCYGGLDTRGVKVGYLRELLVECMGGVREHTNMT